MKTKQMLAVGSAVGTLAYAGLMSALSITSATLPPGQGHSSDGTEMTGSARDAVSPAQRQSSAHRLGGLLSRLRERLIQLTPRGVGHFLGLVHDLPIDVHALEIDAALSCDAPPKQEAVGEAKIPRRGPAEFGQGRREFRR